jgi:hypothetical protein
MSYNKFAGLMIAEAADSTGAISVQSTPREAACIPCFADHFGLRMAAILIVSVLFSTTCSRADTWRGTAPFCAGQCLAGETQIGVSDSGDGGYCVTGHKVLCRNNSQTCPVKETKTSCYGVVLVCDNGFYESPTTNWHSCGKYACGACLGIGSANTTSFSPDTCKQGFVWREATKDDHVCVTPTTRSQAAADNASAAARRSPNGGASGPDTCQQGFVWREVVPWDHVCVTPQVRTTAASDNSLAGQRRAPAQPYGPDTCQHGFVWREAIKNDHVCVTPATRSQAAADNASATARRSPNGGASGPDTCQQGFVWREVVPADHVCVTPQVRATAASDNSLADQRRAGQ